MELTKEVVGKYIHYDPEDGEFFWIKEMNTRGPRKAGTIAGGFNSGGYWQIRFRRTFYYGHSIAWLLTHGYWPKGIDHKNGNPRDNRLCNLREATQSQNIANADYSHMRGIELHGNKFRVRLVIRGKRINVGSFITFEQARIARDAAHYEHFGEHSYFRRG